MKLKLQLFSYSLLIGIFSYGQKPAIAFQHILDSIYLQHPSSVGIMAHVESPENEISWSGAVGFSDKAKKHVLMPDQPALIASCTKTYVSASILRLVEAGKLQLEDPIKQLISKPTREGFTEGGYDLSKIQVKHLLSHTSGIEGYTGHGYIDVVNDDKKHRWTRDEQLSRALKVGSKLGEPGETFSYADANFLLLTEIIEGIEGKPFYTAIRVLLKYKKIGLEQTWFASLEDKPEITEPLVHQYWGERDWDSADIDVSCDLYGGGGIACSSKDLALFGQNLFTGKIIDNEDVLNLIYTEIQTNDSVPSNYYLGTSSSTYQDLKAFGHGGFWGTVFLYFPSLNTTISVYVLEKDKGKIRRDIMNELVRQIKMVGE